jgi:ribosomal protein S18 acetylase RimI-like enzyme
MTAAPTIRRATKADLPAVARLAAKLVRLHHAFDPRRFLCEEPIEPGYERWFHHELANPKAVVLVAERAEGERGPAVIIGYAYGRMEPRDWNALLDACGWLHDVYVDEDARSAGAGRALVEATARELSAMGAPRLMLQTASQNATAQRLFEKLGFRRTMVEMARELDPA